MSLEQYARERPAFRARVLQHKAERQLAVGPNATWLFEDRLTVQYQVQEMLRAERIFEPQGIQEELEARSEEHTSELQSQFHLVCRLLLEKKKKKTNTTKRITT